MSILAVIRKPLVALWRRPTLLRVAVACLGAAWPAAAETLRADLPACAIAIALFGVLSLDVTPVTRREAASVAAMSGLVILLCPAALFALTRGLGLPPDLVLAAALLAASPVAVSAGLQSHVLGLKQRPPTWTALLGVLTAPLVLPLVAWLCGNAGLVDPATLAGRAALFGFLPAAAGLALRRVAPRAIARKQPALRAALLASLLPLGFTAGSTLRAAAIAAPDDFAIALGVGTMTLAVVTLLGVAVGRALPGLRHELKRPGLAVAVVASTRNGSFALAAVVGAISPRADYAFFVVIGAAYVMPWMLRQAARLIDAVSTATPAPTPAPARALNRAAG